MIFYNLVMSLPSEAVHKQPNGEGAYDAANREDGHRQGPQRGHGGFRDGLLISIQPGFIVKRLDDLKHRHINNIT